MFERAISQVSDERPVLDSFGQSGQNLMLLHARPIGAV
jgi:hypothetical protein